MRKRPTLEEIFAHASNAVRELNARNEQFTARPPAPEAQKAATESHRAQNKTEAEWGRNLAVSAPTARVFAQPTRFFPLTGGGTYTPDFLQFNKEGLPVIVWEVKGGYRGPGWEQGYERYKRAALEWSDGEVFQFRMAEKSKGKWSVTEWRRETR